MEPAVVPADDDDEEVAASAAEAVVAGDDTGGGMALPLPPLVSAKYRFFGWWSGRFSPGRWCEGLLLRPGVSARLLVEPGVGTL